MTTDEMLALASAEGGDATQKNVMGAPTLYKLIVNQSNMKVAMALGYAGDPRINDRKTVDGVSGTVSYDVGDDVMILLAVEFLGALWQSTGTNRDGTYVPWARWGIDLNNPLWEASANQPLWSRVGDLLYIKPTPTASVTAGMVLRFIREIPELELWSTNETSGVPLEYHNDVVLMSAARIRRIIGDKESAAQLEQSVSISVLQGLDMWRQFQARLAVQSGFEALGNPAG